MEWEPMPGNPQECRQHATNCRRLAEAASNETARQTFANLAETWERLASNGCMTETDRDGGYCFITFHL
jgi:hypothetical protein